ncbi:group II intron maturase-specific domain-containing protein, partial [Frankia casuarinae]|uniref:group II intron maturase-specific domain-containing protein n=2 Tax=Frankia TaxID=1854 RepID=UPI00228604DF
LPARTRTLGPGVPFERYADDAVLHCASERQAHQVRQAVEDRMAEVGLRLHPTKTRIVYCKDANRRLGHEHTAFTFLGYTFRARAARGRNGRLFASFQPAISRQALTALGRQVRHWRLHRRSNVTLADLARTINPIVRGWMAYYGAFYRSALSVLLTRINSYLVRWIRKKYKRLRPMRKASAAWQRAVTGSPGLFAHWRWVPTFR